MTNRSLIKYQSQAARLGIDNINAHNVPMFLANIVTELRHRPSAGTKNFEPGRVKLPQEMRRETTLYEYYVGMIQDTVRQIKRRGGKAYLFSVEQIADVIKYERDAKFEYLPDADCFEVTM